MFFQLVLEKQGMCLNEHEKNPEKRFLLTVAFFFEKKYFLFFRQQAG